MPPTATTMAKFGSCQGELVTTLVNRSRDMFSVKRGVLDKSEFFAQIEKLGVLVPGSSTHRRGSVPSVAPSLFWLEGFEGSGSSEAVQTADIQYQVGSPSVYLIYWFFV